MFLLHTQNICMIGKIPDNSLFFCGGGCVIYRGTYTSDHFICNLLNEPLEMITSVRLCLSYVLNAIYHLQSLFISMKICIVVTDIVMSLFVPSKSAM